MHKLRAVLIFIGICAALCARTAAQERFDSGDLKGFTKSPTEHIINYEEKVFTVKRAAGFISDPNGTDPLSGVLFEVRDSKGRIYSATTDNKGRFRMPSVPTGEYTFKATLNGFRSVVGTIIVNEKAKKPDTIRLKLHFGV